MVEDGDDTHAGALKEMKGRWKHPISGMGWYRTAKRNFADLPEVDTFYAPAKGRITDAAYAHPTRDVVAERRDRAVDRAGCGRD
jgi:hypothetical protein